MCKIVHVVRVFRVWGEISIQSQTEPVFVEVGCKWVIARGLWVRAEDLAWRAREFGRWFWILLDWRMAGDFGGCGSPSRFMRACDGTGREGGRIARCSEVWRFRIGAIVIRLGVAGVSGAIILFARASRASQERCDAAGVRISTAIRFKYSAEPVSTALLEHVDEVVVPGRSLRPP